MINHTQWRMAGKYGTRRDLVSETLSEVWERFWLCRVQRNHQEKFGSHGACYRCGKALH
jgi:hypothetical protein